MINRSPQSQTRWPLDVAVARRRVKSIRGTRALLSPDIIHSAVAKTFYKLPWMCMHFAGARTFKGKEELHTADQTARAHRWQQQRWDCCCCFFIMRCQFGNRKTNENAVSRSCSSARLKWVIDRVIPAQVLTCLHGHTYFLKTVMT